MSRVLVLDDMPERHEVIGPMLRGLGHDVVEARSYAEAVEALSGKRFEEMWLDHDLEDFEIADLDAEHAPHLVVPGERTGKTGTHVVEAICALPSSKAPRLVVIHSWNPEGARRMAAILSGFGIAFSIQPFSPRWS